MSKENQTFEQLRTAAKSDITGLIAGLVVNSNGYFLSDEQAVNIEAALQEGSQASTALAAANVSRDEAIAGLTASNTALETANQTIAANTTKIAELEAEVARLGAMDAGKGTKPGADGDPNGDSKPKLSIQAPTGDARFS